MPKVTLTFKIPEEQEELKIAQDGGKYLYALDELNNYLRKKIKYEEHTEAEYAIYEDIRTKLWEFRNEE